MITIFGLNYVSAEFAVFELSQLNLSNEEWDELEQLAVAHNVEFYRS